MKEFDSLEKDAQEIFKNIEEFKVDQDEFLMCNKDTQLQIDKMDAINQRLYEIYNVGERKKSLSEADIKNLMNFV